MPYFVIRNQVTSAAQKRNFKSCSSAEPTDDAQVTEAHLSTPYTVWCNEHGCSRRGVVLARLASERPGSTITLSKKHLLNYRDNFSHCGRL
jgi:hypothetical protein